MSEPIKPKKNRTLEELWKRDRQEREELEKRLKEQEKSAKHFIYTAIFCGIIFICFIDTDSDIFERIKHFIQALLYIAASFAILFVFSWLKDKLFK